MPGHRFHRPNIGTVYMGPLDAKPLIETFSCELAKQKPLHDPHRQLLHVVKACLDNPESLTREGMDWLLVFGLSDALNAYAPKGMYFGASETKGEFGFYPAPM